MGRVGKKKNKGESEMKRLTVTFEFDNSENEKMFRAKLFELAQIMKAKFKRCEIKGVKNGNSGVFDSNVGIALGGYKSI